MTKQVDQALVERDVAEASVGKPPRFSRWKAKPRNMNLSVKAKQSRSQTLRRVAVTLPAVSILKDKE